MILRPHPIQTSHIWIILKTHTFFIHFGFTSTHRHHFWSLTTKLFQNALQSGYFLKFCFLWSVGRVKTENNDTHQLTTNRACAWVFQEGILFIYFLISNFECRISSLNITFRLPQGFYVDRDIFKQAPYVVADLYTQIKKIINFYLISPVFKNIQIRVHVTDYFKTLMLFFSLYKLQITYCMLAKTYIKIYAKKPDKFQSPVDKRLTSQKAKCQ